MSEREIVGESELDRAERRLLEACEGIDRQLEATMREVRRANEALPEIKRRVMDREES